MKKRNIVKFINEIRANRTQAAPMVLLSAILILWILSSFIMKMITTFITNMKLASTELRAMILLIFIGCCMLGISIRTHVVLSAKTQRYL